MSILLIGGGGLIGPVLAQKLRDAGEDLVIYSAHKPQNALEGVRYYTGDVCEYGSLYKVYRENAIHCVIHNAGVSSPKLYTDQPYRVCRINVDGVLTSLEAAYGFGVRRFVYVSTAGVYDPDFQGVVDENTPRRASALYRATKIACEELIRNYGIAETVSLRVSFVYGPGRVVACPIRDMVDSLVHGQSVHWEKGADQQQDYIHVSDVADGIAAVALVPKLERAEYNLGSGQGVCFYEIAQMIQKRYPDGMIRIGPGDLGFSSAVLDINHLQKDVGWSPKIDFAEGLADYVAWLDRDVRRTP